MARARSNHFDRVSDYVAEQLNQLGSKHRRFRFIFFATFLLIGGANAAVGGLALTVMVRVVQSSRFDDVGIVALAAAGASLVNLLLVCVNAALRYSYKKDVYESASRSVRHAYVEYAYGTGRYAQGGFETFKRDVSNIVGEVHDKRHGWLRATRRKATGSEV